MTAIERSSGSGRLGWHWLWFAPLAVVILLFVERHTIRFAFVVLELGYRRWDWAAFISPSAAFCLTVVVLSVYWPIFGLRAVKQLIKYRELNARQRWIYTGLPVIGIFLLPFLTDTLIWGSFPFIIDNDGYQRLRMIPFLPWPSGRYLEL